MHEEDLAIMRTFEDILEKDLRKEVKRINDAGTINPSEVGTVTNAICLMLKTKEYENVLRESEYSGGNSYGPMRSATTGRYMSRAMDPYMMDPYAHNSYGMPMSYGGHMSYDRASYDNGYSGHSTKDRMVARLEDMMGEAKNDYERNMIKETISQIQAGN